MASGHSTANDPDEGDDMKVRILGCSGGIGGRQLRTTSILVDNDILIDCGTGVGDLAIADLAQINHVFLTHSHLDHIASLPLLVDTVGDMRTRPLTVHATEATLEIIRAHIFNWAIWPDFSEIPSVEKPYLRYEAIRVGTAVNLDGRKITALPANHTVPAVGYHLNSGKGSLVFSGDTGPCPDLWVAVNRIRNLRYLIIETAFSNREKRLATVSKHLCPSTLAEELANLERTPEIYITHLKPGQIELTMQEIEDGIGELKPRMLQNNEVFDL
jgi:ribonuclease BN (tRNA processing enzyme)